MKGLQILFLVPLFAALQGIHAEDVTVTLQNGLNGYAGTEDAFIADWTTAKTGTKDTVVLEFEQCSG